MVNYLEYIKSFTDKYFWIARILPATIALIPLFILQYFYFNNIIYQGLLNLEETPFLIIFIINLLFLYLASQIIRFFGKDIFEAIIFKKGLKFPTTELLLFSNNGLTDETKKEIRSKIGSVFNLKLPTKTAELSNENDARKRINELIGRVRKKIGYENKILNNYNIEYGFWRNVIGGMPIFIISCILILFFSHSNNMSLFYLTIISLGISFLLIIFSGSILNNYGKKYATELFNEFMGMKND